MSDKPVNPATPDVHQQVHLVSILGGPGSGKGTQCKLLASRHCASPILRFIPDNEESSSRSSNNSNSPQPRYQELVVPEIHHLSIGDLLRAEAQHRPDHELGRTIIQNVATGKLGPPSLTPEVMRNEIRRIVTGGDGLRSSGAVTASSPLGVETVNEVEGVWDFACHGFKTRQTDTIESDHDGDTSKLGEEPHPSTTSTTSPITNTLLKIHIFLLDGFPRGLEQLSYFETHILPISHLIVLECPDETLVQRLASRGSQQQEQAQRRPDDDDQVAVRRRLETFHGRTRAVIEAFRGRGSRRQEQAQGQEHRPAASGKSAMISCVDGEGDVEAVFARFTGAVYEALDSGSSGGADDAEGAGD